MTDRWTDGQAELRWLRRATVVAAVARKNQIIGVNVAEDPSHRCVTFCLRRSKVKTTVRLRVVHLYRRTAA